MMNTDTRIMYQTKYFEKSDDQWQSSTFAEIFKSGEFERLQKLSDACLYTEDGAVFEVHRMFLAYRNKFFLSLFCRNKGENHFYISNIGGQTLDSILVYLYTGNVSLTEANVKDLLVASNILLVSDLQKICRAFAVQNMTTRNCLHLFIAAWNIKELLLLEDCYRFVQTHFEEVVRDSKHYIGDLPFEALNKLLGDRNLNVTNEMVSWKAIVEWSEADTLERLRFIPQLLEHIFLDEMDEDLMTEIRFHSIIKDNPFCYELNSKLAAETSVTNYKTLFKHAKENPQFNSGNSRTRLPLNLNFISYYSMTKNTPLTQLYLTYDEQLDIWREVGDIEFWPDSLIQIRERIYMFNSLDNNCLAFDTSNNILVPISSSPFPRFHYHVVSLEDFIYALGGATERNESTSLMERYDPKSDSWELMKPMVPMILSAAAIVDGLIYAFGEDDDASVPTMVLQIYDSSASNWSFVPAPKVYRQEFAVAVFGGNLYVIGGHSTYECSKSVELYEPSNNAWKDMPDVPFAYVLPKAVVLDGKLMVYEDLFKGKRYGTVYPPVYWNADEEEWVTLASDSPFTNIHLYQFCSLQGSEILKELVVQNRRPGTKWVSSFLSNRFRSLV